MLKRIVVVVVIALVGAGCHYLDPGPGLGPNLAVHVGPPGAQGAVQVDVSLRGPRPTCRCTSTPPTVR
jgi:hypothetical protein